MYMAEMEKCQGDFPGDVMNGGATNRRFSSPDSVPRSLAQLNGYSIPDLNLPGKEEAPSREGEYEEKTAEKRELTFEDICELFDIPIATAAAELKMGVTQLKQICRKLGAPRWPYRQIKSYQCLSSNVQELIPEEGERKLQQIREILERDRVAMELQPDRAIDDETKRLRQVCYKVAFKKRKMKGHVAGGKVLLPGRSSSSTSSCSTSGAGASPGDERAG